MAGEARRARGVIEMDVDGRAPAGVLTDDTGHRFPFTGWTELAAVIEQWREGAPSALGPEVMAHPGMRGEGGGR